MIDSRIIKDVAAAIKNESNGPEPYDTAAEVTRIENGIAWVHIPGGVDETPAELTINAKPGDSVQVRVSGGRAFLVGNGTAPPTDDRMANIANGNASEALSKADTALKDAERAANAADAAEESAKQAQESADAAQESADDAQGSARVANTAANNALTQLSIVEDVSGTLEWIREHGTYVPTTDTQVVAGKIYFNPQKGDYVPVASPDPEADPSAEGWYVLDVTDSQSRYIMAHLAVTAAGLWVLPMAQYVERELTDDAEDAITEESADTILVSMSDPQNASGYKVLLSEQAMTVFDGSGQAVASYGVVTMIGKTTGRNVYIDQDSVDIRNGQTVLASFGEDVDIGDPDVGLLHIDNQGILGIAPYQLNYFEILASQVDFSTSWSRTVSYGGNPFTPFPKGGTHTFIVDGLNTVNLTSVNVNIAFSYTTDGGNIQITTGVTFTVGSAASGSVRYPESSNPRVIFDINYDGDKSFRVTYKSQSQETNSIYLRFFGASGTLTYKAPYFTFGVRKADSLNGAYSFAEGYNTVAQGLESHAEGNGTNAIGNYSHAEGISSRAGGNYSHAEGYGGYSTGDYSHAEGGATYATGVAAHAEGYGTRADGDYASSSGYLTMASGDYQSALGKYNLEDSNDEYALIIGNGTGNNARSNAFAVKWDGNPIIAIDIAAASGTDDGDLYAAITDLGWESEVIV